MPIIIADIGGNQATFHLGDHGHHAGVRHLHPHLGQARRPHQQKGAAAARADHLHTRLDRGRHVARRPTWLISSRVLQGIGAGGLGALGQT